MIFLSAAIKRVLFYRLPAGSSVMLTFTLNKGCPISDTNPKTQFEIVLGFWSKMSPFGLGLTFLLPLCSSCLSGTSRLGTVYWLAKERDAWPKSETSAWLETSTGTIPAQVIHGRRGIVQSMHTKALSAWSGDHRSFSRCIRALL